MPIIVLDAVLVGWLVGWLVGQPNVSGRRRAAQFQPEHIVLKDITGYMRGRVAGEVPALLQAQLLASNIAPDKIEIILPEIAAAQALLRWAGRCAGVAGT